MITNTDPKDPMCCVLVYNDGRVIAQQCNVFQETSTSFTLETFDTMEEMQARVDALGLIPLEEIV
jgi:hypothetical protein